MHAVGDSFSGSTRSAVRRPRDRGAARLEASDAPAGTDARENRAHPRLRVPQVGRPPRQDLRGRGTGTVDGRRCKDLTDFPYRFRTSACPRKGTTRGRRSSELLVVVRDLRSRTARGHRADADAAARAVRGLARPTRKWFAAAYPCQGEECSERQPADLAPGAYGFLGLDTTYNTTRKFLDSTATGTLFKYSWNLNPFVYALVRRARVPPLQRRHRAPACVGLELDLMRSRSESALALGFVRPPGASPSEARRPDRR